jgi:SPP1 gp7 family putative phage head morphogenesis protein
VTAHTKEKVIVGGVAAGVTLSELGLRDAVLRHTLQLLRLSAGQEADAERIIAELEGELKALLKTDLSDAGKAEIRQLINDAGKLIDPAYADAAAVTDADALAVVVSQQTVGALDAAIPGTINTPTAERLASLTKDVLIDGSPASAWWQKQADDTAFKFAAQVRQGVANGWTNEQIVARVSAFMDTAKRNARSLVQSSVMTAANQARLATFRKNANLIAGVRWLSTLDSHTCVVCAALDGQAWDLDGNKLPGTEVEFETPPAHFACRCVLSPIPKSLSEFGINIPEGTRASMNGPVPSSTTFADFLKRQSPEFVDKVLGKKRAEMFLAGKLTLRDLISGTGRELTLDELGI